MKFDFVFHDKGVSINKDKVEDGHIWLDIGNTLDFGVIDHHSSGNYSCTVEALINNLKFIDHLKDNDQIIFHTHKHPDTDGLFSIYLIQYYFHNKNLPNNIETILEYVSNIDSGHIKLSDKITLYKVICFMSEQYYKPDVMNQCLNLINDAVHKNEIDIEFSFMDSDVSPLLSGLSLFEDIKSDILNDYQLYKSERDNKDICDIEDIFLPLSHSTVSSNVPVKALIWKKQPECKFNRIWARSEGFILTVVPVDDKEYLLNGNSIPCTDTIISMPPNSPYSLRPLAHLLEQYEQDKEKSVLDINSSRKRDHSSPRGRHEDGNRFFQSPWSKTSDPWYFTSDHTLVQSPYSGSLLTTSEVIHIVKTFGKCLIKGYRANVIVPFTYTPSDYDKILKWFSTNGWTYYDNININDINGKNIPWLSKEKRYINTLLDLKNTVFRITNKKGSLRLSRLISPIFLGRTAQ